MSEFGHIVAVSVGLEGAKGRRWESSLQTPGLRMSFEVDRQDDETPNACRVTLWNLSKPSQAFVQDNGEICIVEAGVGMSGAIAVVDIDSVRTEREGNDRKTIIEGADGGRAYEAAQVAWALAPGATYRDAFNVLATALGVPLAYAPPVSQKTFPNGVTLWGPVRDNLADLTESIGLVWSIQDGELLVLERGKAEPGQAISITPATGLVGSMKIVEEDGEPGVEFTTRLDARLRPGRLVSLGSRGIHRLFAVKHVGDSYESTEFVSKCKAREVSG